jgi:hypothetical protein
MSMRKRLLEELSQRNRRPFTWPVAEATSDQPPRFPTRYMVGDTVLQLVQRCGGSSRTSQLRAFDSWVSAVSDRKADVVDGQH